MSNKSPSTRWKGWVLSKQKTWSPRHSDVWAFHLNLEYNSSQSNPMFPAWWCHFTVHLAITYRPHLCSNVGFNDNYPSVNNSGLTRGLQRLSLGQRPPSARLLGDVHQRWHVGLSGATFSTGPKGSHCMLMQVPWTFCDNVDLMSQWSTISSNTLVQLKITLHLVRAAKSITKVKLLLWDS